MNNTGAEELINIGVDVSIFVFSLTLLVTLVAKGNDIANVTRDQIANNETVVVSDYDIDTLGYYENSELKYDGVLDGSEVIVNIASIYNKEVKIETNENTVNLNKILYKGKTLLDYVQHVDASYLNKYIDINEKYLRKYVINAHGDVVEVIFTKVR